MLKVYSHGFLINLKLLYLLIIINQLHRLPIPAIIDNLMVVLRCYKFFTSRRNKRFLPFPSPELVWRISSLVKIIYLKLICWLELVLERFFFRSKLFVSVSSSLITIHTWFILNLIYKKRYQEFRPNWQKGRDSFCLTF